MDHIPAVLLIAGAAIGWLLAALLVWQLAMAIVRLVLAAHTPESVSLLLGRLAVAVRSGTPMAPVLRGLRLQLPWPWPWRLGRAAVRLEAGDDAAEVLATSGLLPSALRQQAAAAMRQGPDAFATWCTAVAGRGSRNPLGVRQLAFVLAEVAGMLGVFHFLAVFIFPKFEMIFRDLGLAPTPVFALAWRLLQWEPYIIFAVVAAAAGCWLGLLTLRWRRRRRLAAARLLLIGAAARLPEAALGGGSYSALCAAAGWQAETPAGLARAVSRAEDAEALRAAWLPALVAAAAPILAAIPVALMTIGIMHMLLSILYQVEAST